jgi:hypothetical protein
MSNTDLSKALRPGLAPALAKVARRPAIFSSKGGAPILSAILLAVISLSFTACSFMTRVKTAATEITTSSDTGPHALEQAGLAPTPEEKPPEPPPKPRQQSQPVAETRSASASARVPIVSSTETRPVRLAAPKDNAPARPGGKMVVMAREAAAATQEPKNANATVNPTTAAAEPVTTELIFKGPPRAPQRERAGIKWLVLALFATILGTGVWLFARRNAIVFKRVPAPAKSKPPAGLDMKEPIGQAPEKSPVSAPAPAAAETS